MRGVALNFIFLHRSFALFLMGGAKSRVFMAALLCLLALPARADIPLGLAGPLTGPEASFGEQFRRGARMAIADINAAGGVLGQNLTMVEGDDQCDPKQAVAVANQLVAKHVAVVIGHFCSGSSIPASDVYAEENIVEISPASTNPLFTESGKKNVFRVCGRDDQQGQMAGQFVASHFSRARIAILDDKQAYGEGLASEMRKSLHAAGMSETINDKINPGERDYFAILTKLKRDDIGLLYYGGVQTEAGLLVRQMRELGMKTVLMSGDGIVTRDFWAITGAGGNGTLMTFPPDPAKDPRNKDLVARFMADGGTPEGYTLYTYAAIQAWAEAARQAGTTDAGMVEAALHKGNFDTVLGTIAFDAKGDVRAPGYVIYEWRDGNYDYLKPKG
jgi:branched-chain amino acid transport system substrate-binding protein